APAWLVERLRQEPRQDTPWQDAGIHEAPEFARVASALAAIPNTDASYDVWLMLGMALQSTGEAWARDLWDGWSHQSSKFDEAKQEKSWRSFTSEGQVTIGSLFHLAQQHGWTPPHATLTTYQRRLTARVVRYKRQLYADPYFGARERRAKGI